MFAPYMEIFLIDNGDLNKQDKQIKFLRQHVTILGELAPHKRFSQTSGIIPLIKILLL